MLATLLESRRTVTWPVGNGALSLAVHAGVVALAVALSAASGSRAAFVEALEPRTMETVRYVTAPTASPTAGRRAGRTPRPTRRLVAPTEVPGAIPDAPALAEVDFTALVDAIETSTAFDAAGLVTRADDFTPLEVGGAFARRVASLAKRDAGVPYYAVEVEKMAIPYADNPQPRYPPFLLGGRVEGDVVVQFVIDSTGTADPSSFRVLRSTHELFTRAVRSVLPRLRFLPAEVGGSKVRVLVEQPFRFSVR